MKHIDWSGGAYRVFVDQLHTIKCVFCLFLNHRNQKMCFMCGFSNIIFAEKRFENIAKNEFLELYKEIQKTCKWNVSMDLGGSHRMFVDQLHMINAYFISFWIIQIKRCFARDFFLGQEEEELDSDYENSIVENWFSELMLFQNFSYSVQKLFSFTCFLNLFISIFLDFQLKNTLFSLLCNLLQNLHIT